MLQAEDEKVKGVEAQTASLEAMAEELGINCDHETHVKEHLNDATSNGVLSPVLDDNKGEVPNATQADDGSGTVSGGPERRSRKVKKTKKKSKKRG
jgi:hypothetical protein